MEINSNQLFHRSLCVLKTTEAVEVAFEYEMAAPAPALFESNGAMRKGCKSSLAEALIAESKTGPGPIPEPLSPKYVIDGGFLLHKVVFTRPATFAAITNVYAMSCSTGARGPRWCLTDIRTARRRKARNNNGGLQRQAASTSMSNQN